MTLNSITTAIWDALALIGLFAAIAGVAIWATHPPTPDALAGSPGRLRPCLSTTAKPGQPCRQSGRAGVGKVPPATPEFPVAAVASAMARKPASSKQTSR